MHWVQVSLCLTCVLAMFGGYEAIQCYQCNVNVNVVTDLAPACADQFAANGTGISYCQGTSCAKSWGPRFGQTVFNRTCSNETVAYSLCVPTTIDWSNGTITTSWTCRCANSDNCNSAHVVQATPTIAAAIAVAAVVIVAAATGSP